MLYSKSELLKLRASPLIASSLTGLSTLSYGCRASSDRTIWGACKEGEGRQVEELLEEGADINDLR
jgi:hypothetical protein